jgi:hypothetical protein
LQVALERLTVAFHQVYNHTIGFMGIWNERSWTPDYVKLFRKTLDAANLQHVRLVVADNALGSEDTIAQVPPRCAPPLRLAWPEPTPPPCPDSCTSHGGARGKKANGR